MTRAQHTRYRTLLWPEACRAQGWSAADDAMRRDVTLQATGQDSTAGLSNDQVTDLFRLLEHLADPLNLAKAIPAANPDVAKEENRRRQLFWVIDQQGFEDGYIARCADGACAAEDKDSWRELSTLGLQGLSFTLKTRARQRDAKDGQRPQFIERVTPYHQRKEVKETRATKRAQERGPHVVPRKGVVATDADLLPF